MGAMNGSSSMEEVRGQIELLAAVGSVCRGTRTPGRDCVQWTSMEVGIHVGVMTTQLNRTQPSAMAAGLAVRVSEDCETYLLPGGPSPSHNHRACARNYCARAVSQGGKAFQQSQSLTSACIPLPCMACPESTALHTAGHPQPHGTASPHTTHTTPSCHAAFPPSRHSPPLPCHPLSNQS